MTLVDLRACHLGWVEAHVRLQNPDLLNLWLTGQCHYGSSGFAFIVVHGVDDTNRRRAIRSQASGILERLGHAVHLQAGRDVYHVEPERPTSKHELLEAISSLSKHVSL